MHHIKAQNLQPAPRLNTAPLIASTAEIADCHFGTYVEVQDFSRLEDATLDNYSYVCRFCSIMSATIGKFCNIADMVRINPGNHPIERPSLHHFTYRPEQYALASQRDEAFFNWRRRQRVELGHDVWIGHGAVIMPGTRIGNGAVVGSLSVVTKDVPAYAVAAGVPARVLRMRFPAAIAEAVQQTRWWDWSHQTLQERLEDFKDLRTFLDKYAP
jgi:phosphonate metabolism protein (transferase hexapeptide repeat family)